MTHRPAPAGRAGRILLAVLLTAASLGFGADHTTAAAPAELISVDPATGGPLSSQDNQPSVSGDGNIVAWTGNPPIGSEFVSDWVYVRDRGAQITTPVPAPFNVTAMNGAVLSRDGCHVAFWGFYPQYTFTLLRPPPFPPIIITIPSQWDVYTWDRCTADTTPVAVSNATGFQTYAGSGDRLGPLAISADGRYVAYDAYSATAGERIARIDTSGTISEAQLSGGAFNVNSMDISDNGAFIALGGQTTISDLTRNEVVGWSPPCITGIAVVCNTEVVSLDNSGNALSNTSTNPSVSADGRYVAFASNATEFVGAVGATSPQIYVRDRISKVTKLVSTSPPAAMAGALDDPEISPDGTQIALVEAPNPPPGGKPVKEVFVARSTAGYFDAAVFDLVSYGVSGAPTSTDSFSPSMSSTGRYVAFTSGANSELSGVRMVSGLEVWMRQRPIALDITPSLDFGTVDIGATSAAKNAVVTNTSGVAINIGAVTPPAAPFSITGNTCGGALQPGASCAITIVFSPTAPGSASSSVTVTGDGLSVSASLVGAGRSNVKPGSLSIKPKSANYGSGPIGTVIAPKTFTVSNPGQTAVPLAGVGLSGGGADQFAITNSTCVTSLGPGATCIVEVGATITREGSLTATLGVQGTGGQSATATLRIAAVFTPTLKMLPGVAAPGEVTTAVGAGFPPNIDVQLAFEGESPFATVHTDGSGNLRFDLVLLPHGVRIGGRQVIAVDQPDFSGVRAPLLIQLATSRPSGFANPLFTSGVRALITRGG